MLWGGIIYSPSHVFLNSFLSNTFLNFYIILMRDWSWWFSLYYYSLQSIKMYDSFLSHFSVIESSKVYLLCHISLYLLFHFFFLLSDHLITWFIHIWVNKWRFCMMSPGLSSLFWDIQVTEKQCLFTQGTRWVE